MKEKKKDKLPDDVNHVTLMNLKDGTLIQRTDTEDIVITSHMPVYGEFIGE